jgi:hypothetical protein
MEKWALLLRWESRENLEDWAVSGLLSIVFSGSELLNIRFFLICLSFCMNFHSLYTPIYSLILYS